MKAYVLFAIEIFFIVLIGSLWAYFSETVERHNAIMWLAVCDIILNQIEAKQENK